MVVFWVALAGMLVSGLGLISITVYEKRPFERAIIDYSESIRLNPQIAEPYYNRGLAYKHLGRKVEAIANFEKFITLSDNPQWIEYAEQQIEELSK